MRLDKESNNSTDGVTMLADWMQHKLQGAGGVDSRKTCGWMDGLQVIEVSTTTHTERVAEGPHRKLKTQNSSRSGGKLQYI